MKTTRANDSGLLIIRIGIGLIFLLIHGLTKVRGGQVLWQGLGESMSIFGITFAPAFWGFMAALSEFGGGICLIGGILFRPACALLMFTMLVAVITGFSAGHGLTVHPLELFIVFTGLLLTGPGRFTLGHLVHEQRQRNRNRRS